MTGLDAKATWSQVSRELPWNRVTWRAAGLIALSWLLLGPQITWLTLAVIIVWQLVRAYRARGRAEGPGEPEPQP